MVKIDMRDNEISKVFLLLAASLMVILSFSGCMNSGAGEDSYNVYFGVSPYEIIYDEPFDVNEGETLDINVIIEQQNLYVLFVRIYAYDGGWRWDQSQDEFSFLIIPPTGVECEFDPFNEFREVTDTIVPINVYINELPRNVTVKAENTSEANKTAEELYGTTYGSGEWTFQVEWIGDGSFNMDDGGSVRLELWIYPYRIESIKRA